MITAALMHYYPSLRRPDPLLEVYVSCHDDWPFPESMPLVFHVFILWIAG